ncbi:MAG: STAS domain-containing protein [Burkholderiaceae bacterium]
MAKEDGGGLLSRMVKLVRSPGANWSQEDAKDSGQESLLNKQMLKEMIERKKRNDFVRKREFDMLRKLRRNEAMAGQDLSARPSFFQSSLPSKPDDRAVTLKKIDEIEAQMSMQWWKTKHGDSSVQPQSFQASTPSASSPPRTASPPAPASRSAAPAMVPARPVQPRSVAVSAAQSPSAAPGRPDLPPLKFETTEPDQISSATENLPTTPMALAPAPPAKPSRTPVPSKPGASKPMMGSLAASYEGGTTGFSASKLFAIEVDETVHDPELEEAAIRFANGDDASVEMGLLEVLSPKGSRANHLETWMALFDFYRATGAQSQFESAAIDFAGRFDRSAPMWFSLPDAVVQIAPAPATNAPQQSADWNCPSTIGIQSLAVLNAAIARVTGPVKLNWGKLVSVEDAALEPLSKIFSAWSKQPIQLRFIGVENLERILSSATPSGDTAVNPQWWHLRLEALRVMHRPDEFELVALDYCVTYEVSPPSWDGARCEYKPLDSHGGYVPGHTIIGNAQHDSNNSSLGSDSLSADGDSQMANVSTVELSGQILGDAAEVLKSLEDKLLGADIMVISCARLIRVDFSAVGSLLNWVSARQAEGRQVQFNNVNRLVAAFFKVIGINEHAKVIARSD